MAVTNLLPRYLPRGDCSCCSWRRPDDVADSRDGPLVFCEFFDTRAQIDAAWKCESFTTGDRDDGETRVQQLERLHGQRLNVQKMELAQLAHKRAGWAFVLSVVAVLISLVGLWLDNL